MIVNGNAVHSEIEPRKLLVDYLRDDLKLTGTHVGCDTSQCGACVVHVDGNRLMDGTPRDEPSLFCFLLRSSQSEILCPLSLQ